MSVYGVILCMVLELEFERLVYKRNVLVYYCSEMNTIEIEGTPSNLSHADAREVAAPVQNPYAELDLERTVLKATHDVYIQSNRDPAELNGRFQALFDRYVDRGVKRFGKDDGEVDGIGFGEVNNVFRLKSRPFHGARMGTTAEPGKPFGRELDAFGVIVILDSATNLQQLHVGGLLTRPVRILCTKSGDGTPRHHAVLEEAGRQQIGIKLVVAQGVQFAVEVEAGERKRGHGQHRMGAVDGTVVTYQRENAGPTQAGWVVEGNKEQEVVAGVGESISTFVFRAQLQGACACVDEMRAYEGFERLPERYKTFMTNYFSGGPESSLKRPGGPAFRSRATFANLSVGEDMVRREKTVYSHDSAHSVAVTLCMTVGVITYGAAQDQEGTAPVEPSLLSCLKSDKNPQAAYILATTFELGDVAFAMSIRHHDGKQDKLGKALSQINMTRQPLKIICKTTVDLLTRVMIYTLGNSVKDCELTPIYLKAQPGKSNNGLFEEQPEPTVTLKSVDCWELDFPLLGEAGDNVDGVKFECKIEGKKHVVLLHTHPAGTTYPDVLLHTHPAETACPAVVPLEAVAGPAPAGGNTTVQEWMQGMTHADPALEARKVVKYGFLDAQAVTGAAEEDIDDMLTSDKLGWNDMQQRQFKRKWEKMGV
jgi:hypothetical protein